MNAEELRSVFSNDSGAACLERMAEDCPALWISEFMVRHGCTSKDDFYNTCRSLIREYGRVLFLYENSGTLKIVKEGLNRPAAKPAVLTDSWAPPLVMSGSSYARSGGTIPRVEHKVLFKDLESNLTCGVAREIRDSNYVVVVDPGRSAMESLEPLILWLRGPTIGSLTIDSACGFTEPVGGWQQPED